MSGAFGQVIKQQNLDAAFLTSPGEDLILKTFRQMQLVTGNKVDGDDTFPFQALFGPYEEGKDQQRWADYQRFDWSIRQLPVFQAFESQTESRSSDQGFVTGTISFQAYWPASARRSDLGRVQAAFRGIMQNFFSSEYVKDMLDELYYIQRPNKVYGLNEYGKTLTWSPNVEGIVESELVPVTIVDVNYRVDLRAWYRALEFQNRTKAQPFKESLADLEVVSGEYDGTIDPKAQDVPYQYVLEDEIEVSNP